MQEAAYGATLLLLLMLDGAREGINDDNMNKYIEDYIKQRKLEIAEEERLAKESEKEEVLFKLHIGAKEYYKDFLNEPADNFPFYDSAQQKHYRYNLGDVTDDEYAELLKYIPSENKPKVDTNKKMSGWYTFSIIMVILGCIGGFIIGIMDKFNILYVIFSVLVSLIFFSQIILLCKIEYNTQSN